MVCARIARCLPGLAGALLLSIGGFAGGASAQTGVVTSVADLESALAATATSNTATSIRIAAGTYNIARPLFLDALGGVTVGLQSAGDGPVILQAVGGQDILRTGWNSNDGGGTGPSPGFIVKGLTFSGAGTAINSAVGRILVADCTFVDNNLGFYIDFSRGRVTLENDTFTQNGAACPTDLFCGGLRFDSHESSTATNVTVVGNQPYGVKDLMVLQNSIVSGNTAPPGTRGGDCFSRSGSVSSSIDSDGSCGATTADPQLAALADNGGLVKTMALPAKSPAENAGTNALCPGTDARGASRADGACDIGAFERSQAFSTESVTGAGAVAFSAAAGTFVDFHAVDPNTPPQKDRPAGVSFPFGLFEWTLIGLQNGATVEVSISFPSPVPVPPQYWKAEPGGAWKDVCLLVPCIVDPSIPNVLRLTLTDGGVGDFDGSQNGVIRDPGGPGVSEAPADRSPPTTVATPSPAANAAGWNNTSVAVALTAQDEAGGSGVNEIAFSLSGAQTGSGTVAGSAASVAISAEGSTTVTWFARDNAGNQEAAKTLVVRIDKTPPEAALRFDPEARDLAVSARDAISGPGAVALASVVAAPARGDDDSDERERRRAELRTFAVRDVADNLLTVVMMVKKERHHLETSVVSLQYGAGAVMTPPPNEEKFAWDAERAGVIEQLEQHIQVGRREPQLEVEAAWRAKTNRTVIEIEHPRPATRIVRNGLVLLQLVTQQGALGFELSPPATNTGIFAGAASRASKTSPSPGADAGGCSTSGIADGPLLLLGLATLLRRRGRHLRSRMKV